MDYLSTPGLRNLKEISMTKPDKKPEPWFPELKPIPAALDSSEVVLGSGCIRPKTPATK